MKIYIDSQKAMILFNYLHLINSPGYYTGGARIATELYTLVISPQSQSRFGAKAPEFKGVPTMHYKINSQRIIST